MGFIPYFRTGSTMPDKQQSRPEIDIGNDRIFSVTRGWKPFYGEATTRSARSVTSQQEQKTLHAFFHQRCSRFQKAITPDELPSYKYISDQAYAPRETDEQKQMPPQDVDFRRKQNRRSCTLIRRAPLSSEFKFPNRDGLKSSCPKCGDTR